MPVNFNLLRQAGPANFAEGLMQGQEDVRRNALAQQQAAQQQQMNAMSLRKSEFDIRNAENQQVNNRRTQKASMFRERLLRAPTPEAARQIVAAQYNDPDLGPVLSQSGTLEQSLAEVSDDPAAFERYKQQEAMGMAEWIKTQAPKVIGNALVRPSGEVLYKAQPELSGDVATMKQLGYPLTQEGFAAFQKAKQNKLLSPEEEAQQRRIRESGRAPAAAAAPVAGGPAGAPDSNLAKKDIQKREAVLPQARQAVSTVSNTMSVIGETVDRLLANEAGLNGITGLIGGRTPGITDVARQAEADIEQLKNLAFIQGITELRNASKTGAGVGNVSNKEGERFENLKASLDRKQSLSDMIAALKRLKSQSEFTKQSIKEAFDETYSYREGAAKPAAPVTSKGAKFLGFE